jgi:quercetin dioxygenase-like cupin family protein
MPKQADVFPQLAAPVASYCGGIAMTLIRRQLLQVAGALALVPALSRVVLAQAPAAGPKLTQLLKKDIEGQAGAVQETIVSIVEFGPGVAAPWHMHPSAQEALYALEGNLIVEVEGRGTTAVKLGEAYIIPGDIPHLAKNDSTSAGAKALTVHTRGVKDKPFVVPVRRP